MDYYCLNDSPYSRKLVLFPPFIRENNNPIHVFHEFLIISLRLSHGAKDSEYV